jgi:hypothetical protein
MVEKFSKTFCNPDDDDKEGEVGAVMMTTMFSVQYNCACNRKWVADSDNKMENKRMKS